MYHVTFKIVQKITQAGYVGSDVEDCLVGLLRMCNYDVERAQMGIVVLDEIDKVAKERRRAFNYATYKEKVYNNLYLKW